MIFTSEKLLPIQVNNLDTLFNTSFGLSYLCTSIYQTKFNEYQGHCLSKESFDDLFKLIFGTLLCLSKSEETLSNLENARLLTKSTFYYYRYEVNKESHYIYQEIANKKGSFPIWKNNNFWMKWFELEIKENIDNSKFTNKEDFYFTILIELSTNMYNLNIECKFILGCICDYIAEKFIKDVFIISITL